MLISSMKNEQDDSEWSRKDIVIAFSKLYFNRWPSQNFGENEKIDEKNISINHEELT